jgi:hypothetical protein
MQRTLFAIPLLLLLGVTADGEEGHSLRGVFCRTEAQVAETFDHMRMDLGPRAAVGLTNRDEVVCVYADRIDYVIVRPLVIGEQRHRGVSLVLYEGMLTGVRVGGNLRPVEPAVRIFFVQPGRLQGATVIGKA